MLDFNKMTEEELISLKEIIEDCTQWYYDHWQSDGICQIETEMFGTIQNVPIYVDENGEAFLSN